MSDMKVEQTAMATGRACYEAYAVSTRATAAWEALPPTERWAWVAAAAAAITEVNIVVARALARPR